MLKFRKIKKMTMRKARKQYYDGELTPDPKTGSSSDDNMDIIAANVQGDIIDTSSILADFAGNSGVELGDGFDKSISDVYV